MRQVFDKGFFMGGALASAMTISKGKLPPKNYATHPNAEAPLRRTNRAARYPAPDGKLTFDKLSSVFASGNRTRDDQPNPSGSRRRSRASSPRCGSRCAPRTCTRSATRTGGDGRDKLAPSNCVQCGAISAKGRRLTPPEGGSGPEYTLT